MESLPLSFQTASPTEIARGLTVHTNICTLSCVLRMASANFRKHGVRFSEAESIFNDDAAVTIKDDTSDTTEERFVTLGIGLKGRILAVVYCYRGDVIRIISVRKATNTECQQYE